MGPSPELFSSRGGENQGHNGSRPMGLLFLDLSVVQCLRIGPQPLLASVSPSVDWDESLSNHPHLSRESSSGWASPRTSVVTEGSAHLYPGSLHFALSVSPRGLAPACCHFSIIVTISYDSIAPQHALASFQSAFASASVCSVSLLQALPVTQGRAYSSIVYTWNGCSERVRTHE